MAIEYIYLEDKSGKITRVSKAVYEGNKHRFENMTVKDNVQDPFKKKTKAKTEKPGLM